MASTPRSLTHRRSRPPRPGRLAFCRIASAELEVRAAVSPLFPGTLLAPAGWAAHHERENWVKFIFGTLAVTVIASFVALAPASAGPASLAKTVGQAVESPLIQVQGHRGKPSARHGRAHAPRHGRAHSHRYRPGGHYRSAPRGWHRHSHRPGNWSRRGCISVGPAWFCP